MQSGKVTFAFALVDIVLSFCIYQFAICNGPLQNWTQILRFYFMKSARAAFLLFLLFLSCATPLRHYHLIEQQMDKGDWLGAEEAVAKSWSKGYGERNRVLFDLDRGLLLHFGRKFQESNSFFFGAEGKMEELYTKRIRDESASLLVNANLLPYGGEDFEKVLTNFFAALNYLQMGDLENALVEARKIDHKLSLLGDKYEGKGRYHQDGLAQYLSGFIYELMGRWDDAYISYHKSFEAYRGQPQIYPFPPPSFLTKDLLRLSQYLGRDDDFHQLRAKFGSLRWREQGKVEKGGRVLILAFSGRGPVKKEFSLTVEKKDKKGNGYTFKLALPRFAPRPSQIASAEVLIDGKTQPLILAEDIGVIARKVLEDRLPLIEAKAVARALAKAKANQEAKKKMGGGGFNRVLKFGLDEVVKASERADLRCWRTLPAKIYLGRFTLPPGPHRAGLRFVSSGGQILQEIDFTEFNLEKGGYRVLEGYCLK